MKYVVILGDGMADVPIQKLGDKTPLEYAKTPMMDKLAKNSEVGMVHTIPVGMSPGSDVANLSVLGYNPKEHYSGRSPLEALSIGIPMQDDHIAFRANLVTLSEEETEYEKKTIIDHSSGEISTEEASILLEAVKKELETEIYHFYVGTSYRHCFIWEGGEVVSLCAPHDYLGKCIKEYLPKEAFLYEMMRKSYDILVNHPINQKRKEQGLNPANSLWFWGAGTKPSLYSFEQKTNQKGAMISAVDLLKGIAVGTGMKVVEVEGANGGLYTNYEGKAQATLQVLTEEGCDFVYVHLEGPDEMGHQGNLEYKIKAIENLDERIIKPIVEGLKNAGEDFRMLILPDHPTPVHLRTHTSDAVPYMLYDSVNHVVHNGYYNEKDANATGIVVEEGHHLIDKLFEV